MRREELYASIEDMLERACVEMETGRLDVPVSNISEEPVLCSASILSLRF